jgi:hypothetical protein
MTVQEVQAATVALAEAITAEVQVFEAATGCIVHSIPIHPAAGSSPVTAEVKVQIAG